MEYGWVGTILFMDLSTGKIRYLNTMRYAKEYIGGRGIAAKIAYEYIPLNIDAFDPRNPLIAMTGPLTGTLAPTSGRIVFCSVSPRVYPKPWYTHSTMGGFFGSELKYAGFDGLVLVGRSKEPVYLWIHDGKTEILPGIDLYGLTVRSAVKKFYKKHGKGVQVACIGPAGENLVRYAVISHPPENASGHSGFGAVMGSKNLKAIVIKGEGGVKIADPNIFVEACKHAMDISRAGTIDDMDIGYDYPIPATRPVCSQSCSVNCRIGQVLFNIPRRFGKRGIVRGHQAFCVGCIWLSDNSHGGYEGGRVRIPPITGWKPDGGGVDLHTLCNDLGIDLWVLLTFQPWLVRCVELGIDRLEDWRLNPRDAQWFRGLLQAIAYRKGIGDILAEDLRRAMYRWNGKIPEDLVRLADVLEFDFGFPAHREGRVWDPEPLPFWLVSALMYASESRDPTICTHTSLLCAAYLYLNDKELFLSKFRPVAKRLWGSEKAIEPSFEDKPQLAIWCQHRHIMLDCLPLCEFSFPRLLKSFKSREEWIVMEDIIGDLDIEASLLSACTGLEFVTGDLERTAEKVFNLERMILVKRFGRDRKIDEMVAPHFQLPCNTDGTSISVKEFQKLLDKYYEDRGWEISTGIPSKKKLVELGLEECV